MEPFGVGVTSATCQGDSGLGAITEYFSPEVCKTPPTLPPINDVPCQPSRMHSATCFAGLLEETLTMGGLFRMSLVVAHPANSATASAPTNNFMQVTPVGKDARLHRNAAVRITSNAPPTSDSSLLPSRNGFPSPLPASPRTGIAPISARL